ncbi:hypothetical protein SMICM304S_09647 [Streptomyces microflavus]
MRVSWPSMSDWLRRERLVKIALTLPRSMACSAASRTASRCTWSKARATSPISSCVVIGMGCTWVSTRPGSVRESWSTREGSRCSAMEKAAVRSWRIERLIWRAMSPATRKAASRAMTTARPLTIASRLASEEIFAALFTALVTSSSSTVAYPWNLAVAAAIQVSGVMPFFARSSGSWPWPICWAMPSKTEPSMLGGDTNG